MRLTATPVVKPPPQHPGPNPATNPQAEPGIPASRCSTCKQAASDGNLAENGVIDSQAGALNITATRGRGIDDAAAVDAKNDASSNVGTVGNAHPAVYGSADGIGGSSAGAGVGRATFTAGDGECEREISATVTGRSGCDQQKQEQQGCEAVLAESQRAPTYGGGGALKPTMDSGSQKIPAAPTAAAAGGSPTVADDGRKGKIIAGVMSERQEGVDVDGAHSSDADHLPSTSTAADDSRDNSADAVRLEEAAAAAPVTAVAAAGGEGSNAAVGFSQWYSESAATGAARSTAAGASAPTKSISRRWTTMANYTTDEGRYLRADDNGWRRVWQSQGGGGAAFGWMNRGRESGGRGEKSAEETAGGGARGAGVVGSGGSGGVKKRFKVSFSTDAVDQAAANGHLEVRLLSKWLGARQGFVQLTVRMKSGMVVLPSFPSYFEFLLQSIRYY